MPFEDANISNKTANRLKALTAHDRFSHAYIFNGAEEAAFGAAKEFVKAAFCESAAERPCGECLICKKIGHDNHEDVVYVTREGNSITVSQIEELQSKLRNKPFSSQRIAAVIRDADRMTPQSQNKLLKTLEEPAPGYIIILISENHERLLKTILSRCVLVAIEQKDKPTNSEADAHAEALIHMLFNDSSYFEITKRLETAAADKDASLLLLDSLERKIHEMLLSNVFGAGKVELSSTVPKIIGLIEEAARDLSYNISNKYTMRNLVLRILDILR